MKKPSRNKKPLFVSIKVKMLLNFLLTFFVFVLLIGYWGIFCLGYLLDRMQTTQSELNQAVRNGITVDEVLSLEKDGSLTPKNVNSDARYIKLLNWLDTVHQVRPSAWPFIYVPSATSGKIVYVVDLQSKYNSTIAKNFLQTDTMPEETSPMLSGDALYHSDRQGLINYLHSLDKLLPDGSPNQGLSHFLDVFSKEITTYGTIKDSQGKALVGVGVRDENIFIQESNPQVIGFLILSFFGSILIMILVGFRSGNVFTHPIVHLTRAAEFINAGDNEAGLRQLQKSHPPRFSIDEIGQLSQTIRTLVTLQSALYTISAAANKTSDLNTLFELAYKKVSDLIPADTFMIALFDETVNQIKLITATCDLNSNFVFNIKQYPLTTPPDLIGYVIQTGQALLLNNRELKKLQKAAIIQDDCCSVNWLGVPIQSTDQRPIGALVAQSFSKGSLFTQNDKALFVFIASQLAMIVNRSQAENELRQSYQMLEKRVQDRTSDLQESNLLLEKEIGERERAEIEMQAAKEAAEAANIAKSAFLANMSHELRTPLNAILGFSNLMAHDPNFPIQQKEDLGIILQSGEYLLDLINDVLEMSKIESGKMSLTPVSFDLYQLLNEVEEVFMIRAAEKNLSLIHEKSSDLPQYIFTDEKKLRQILFNLLSNAVKFTSQGGLTLRSRLMEPINSDQMVHLGFEVEDTGPGIAPNQIKDLFNYFVQTDTGKKSLEGTGLGLSISKNLIRMLDGEIHVTSHEGKGSIFSFDIKVKLASPVDIQTKPRERRVIGMEPTSRTWRILITEDREANRKLLVKLLQPFTSKDGGSGFLIREAVNGKEALEVWREWAPDLIFMDMRMPEMNGHEATQAIRSLTDGKNTKIIALTASAFEEERQFILSEGIDDFIRKPFKEFEIFNVLSKHLDGVHFIYSEEDGDSHIPALPNEQQTTLLANEIQKLSADWQQALKFAAEAADADRIHQLLQQIDPDHASLVEPIEALVAQYRFDLILKLIP